MQEILKNIEPIYKKFAKIDEKVGCDDALKIIEEYNEDIYNDLLEEVLSTEYLNS